MKRYSCRFDQLMVGALFIYNGDRCRKRSNHTGEYLEYSRWFYFRNNEQVVIVDLSGLKGHRGQENEN